MHIEVQQDSNANIRFIIKIVLHKERVLYFGVIEKRTPYHHYQKGMRKHILKTHLLHTGNPVPKHDNWLANINHHLHSGRLLVIAWKMHTSVIRHLYGKGSSDIWNSMSFMYS